MADQEGFNDILKKSLCEFETRLEKSFKAETECSIAGLKAEITANFTNKLAEVDAKLLGIEKSQQFISDQYEMFRAQVGHVLKQNTDLRNENKKVATRVRDLEKKDQVLVKTIDDLEQYGRREMVEIGGIPRSRNEDCE